MRSPGQIVSQTESVIDAARWPIARRIPEPVMEDAYDETEYGDDSFGSPLSAVMVK
jgi:hypothetical protein